MSPNELAIIMAVRKNDAVGLKQLTHVTDIAGPPLHYICNSLCRDGYLKKKNQGEYQVTWEGVRAIIMTLLEI